AMSIAIAPFKAAPGVADGEQRAVALRRDLVLGLSSLLRATVRLVQIDAASTVPRARHLVAGDVETGTDGRMSLALQMLDVRAGSQIWAQRFDVPAPGGDGLQLFGRRVVAA